MTIETLATFAIALGLPVWLLTEEIVRRLDLRFRAMSKTEAPAARPVRVQPLPAQRAA